MAAGRQALRCARRSGFRRSASKYAAPLSEFAGVSEPHPGDTAQVLAQIEAAEGAHYLAALALAPWMVYALVHDWWGATVAFVLIQIGFNVYPAMHLRSVRARLCQLADRRHLRGRPTA